MSKDFYVTTPTVKSITKICKRTSPSMIEGLEASHHAQLEADLKAGNVISVEDEGWLDGAASGNLVDEERVGGKC